MEVSEAFLEDFVGWGGLSKPISGVRGGMMWQEGARVSQGHLEPTLMEILL